ncbi:MAG TPA: hypothetical protein VGP46_00810, partial [Acidimicrobiales bacterium]|nr:hypothetical protein [Acidimicrobiales bacterium]
GQTMPLFFTVSNDEGRAVTYHYVIREKGSVGSWATLPETGTESVPAGATWTVDTKVAPHCSASPCRVEVLLPGHPETIDFLVSLSPGT